MLGWDSHYIGQLVLSEQQSINYTPTLVVRRTAQDNLVIDSMTMKRKVLNIWVKICVMPGAVTSVACTLGPVTRHGQCQQCGPGLSPAWWDGGQTKMINNNGPWSHHLKLSLHLTCCAILIIVFHRTTTTSRWWDNMKMDVSSSLSEHLQPQKCNYEKCR